MSKGKLGSLLDIKNDMEKLQGTLPMVRAILEDAEVKQVTRPAVRIWLSKLKDVACEAEVLLLQLPLLILFKKKAMQTR